jgi:branched-subunit amino acid aminotransferase/4-amino-4-deoxychorismate lyase
MESAQCSGFDLYGRGVFTTLAIVESEPFLWHKHWHRLTSNATALGIDLSDHAEDSVHDALLDSIAESETADGRARITFSDGSPSRIWSQDEGEKTTTLSIIVAERRPVPDSFRLTVSPHHLSTTSPLAGIKSCNYLDHLLAYEQATNRGFHEAIRLNERDEFVSACMANVFWETDGELFTPSLNTGCLAGTTREYVLENIECAEIAASIQELATADRIFLTSAGLGIVAVAEFDGRRLNTSDHPLSSLLPF